jgi:hypothetical protein
MRIGKVAAGGPAAGAVRRTAARVVTVLAVVAASGCGQLQRQGSGSSYLIVNASSSSVSSDVGGDRGAATGGIAADTAEVTFQLAMKDPGSTASPTTPTAANFITINQYRVKYIRTDGRNTEGVDVPYSFDGGMTVTVGAEAVTTTFTLVRHIAKNEAPLRSLNVNGLVISVIAQVTFYGHDQTGRAVSADARFSVDFGNFVDQS